MARSNTGSSAETHKDVLVLEGFMASPQQPQQSTNTNPLAGKGKEMEQPTGGRNDTYKPTTQYL
ncbi:14790_t:CDS:2 [Dentiscutata erythropus]|uniref:14790_t:CDS:1 n=1 Tax=Dentiscutata erythropus TaxID=1348616 RepID=A0A9N9H7G2_9GLOM|nr:14790_t:CDS:2 [Dentiscutata erythropus]